MTDRAELREAFEAERQNLLAWGLFVTSVVVQQLQDEIQPRRVVEFLKIWPEPRVKDTDSFLSKAVRPGKNYKDPLTEITDKVGTRFVTLLLHEIRTVESIVVGSPYWYHEKARDFEEEKAKFPLYFDYQSVHYVVRAKEEMHLAGGTVPAGTPCEVQVRTLLQHAYSELAHDATYKPKAARDPALLRHVAKSMALIEVTDEIFVNVNKTLQAANAATVRALGLFAQIYTRNVLRNVPTDLRLSETILDAYGALLPQLEESTLDSFFSSRHFIFDRVRLLAPVSELFAQPVVLAVYYLVFVDPEETWKQWPLDVSLLEPIFADLGISAANL